VMQNPKQQLALGKSHLLAPALLLLQMCFRLQFLVSVMGGRRRAALPRAAATFQARMKASPNQTQGLMP